MRATPGVPPARRNLPIVLSLSQAEDGIRDRKGTRLNSSHTVISYAVFCLKKEKLEERLGTNGIRGHHNAALANSSGRNTIRMVAMLVTVTTTADVQSAIM